MFSEMLNLGNLKLSEEYLGCAIQEALKTQVFKNKVHNRYREGFSQSNPSSSATNR
jgi:hypothetical protein